MPLNKSANNIIPIVSNGKIDSLQYLRAFASIWVLLTHCFQRLSLAPFGYTFSGQYGVDVFFLLSGFIIYQTTKDEASYKSFIVKRFLRIFPLYWFTLIVCTVYYNCEYSISSLIQNLFMIPYAEAIDSKSLVVGQAWSTCYELYFYFIFSIILFFNIKKKKLPLIIISIFVISNVITKIGFLNDIGFGRFILSLTGGVGILLFVVGIIISGALQKGIAYKNSNYLPSEGLIILLSILLSLFVFTNYNWIYSLIWATITFITWLLINKTVIKYQNKIFNKIIIWLGDISFSIYLTHIVIINIYLQKFNIDNIVLLIILTLMTTICCSTITYYGIEKPFINIARKYSKK